jgi:hypothetical protein
VGLRPLLLAMPPPLYGAPPANLDAILKVYLGLFEFPVGAFFTDAGY